MKVLFVNTVELSANGISTCILNYYRELVKQSVEIDILTPSCGMEDIKRELQNNGSRLFEIPYRNSNVSKYFFDLARIIKREKYDIMHVHGNSCTVAVELFAAWLGGCKVRIAHSHNTTCEHKKANKLLRPLFELMCTERVACGEDAGKWLFHNKDFFVLNNGIYVEKFVFDAQIRNEYRNKLHLEDEILLGHVGLFNYQKNHEFLIRIFEKLVEKNNNYKLMLIGEGELKEKIQKLVEKQGLLSKVIFMGNTREIAEYMSAMDMFVLPSRYEGLPYVLIEAQAAGLPCLAASTVSGEVKLMENMEFLSLEDVEGWVCAIKEKPTIREKDAEKIQKVLRQNGFDIRENGKRLKEFYEKILNRKKNELL